MMLCFLIASFLAGWVVDGWFMTDSPFRPHLTGKCTILGWLITLRGGSCTVLSLAKDTNTLLLDHQLFHRLVVGLAVHGCCSLYKKWLI